MKKKIVALVLVLALAASLAIGLAACNDPDNSQLVFGPEDADITFGMICLHDENSTYDANFINAARELAASKNVRVIIKTGIPESDACYNAAADLVDQGCDVIFADSFGHETYIMQAAREFKDVEFAHATGTYAHTENLSNFHNGFATIYEGRYLAGVVAGYELNEMIANGKITADQAKMGYVGAYPYAEVVSGYTSFYLGAKSVCPSVTMEVRYTGSWYNETAERATAEALIEAGCVLISQHADSSGAPTACEEANGGAGVPNVTYNVAFPGNSTYLVGSRINWTPYFEYIIDQMRAGEEIAADWTGDLNTSSVLLLEYGAGVSAEVKTAVEAVLAELEAGTRKVFDVSTFTVSVITGSTNSGATVDEGGHLTAYMADVNTDSAYTADTQVIKTENGITYFSESDFRSAPYFDVRIDGITEINN